MVFDVRNENKELLERYDDVFNGLIDKIKKMMMIGLNIQKITWKFNSDDNLPLNEPLKFYQMTITIRYAISEDNKLYPQVFLDGALFSL